MDRNYNILVHEGTPKRKSHLPGRGLVIACETEFSGNVNTQILTVVLLLRRCLIESRPSTPRQCSESRPRRFRGSNSSPNRWDGAFQHVEIHRGSDLLLAFTMREMSIPMGPTLKKAVFEVRLTGVDKPRIAWVRPPSTAAFGRGEEAALIEQWLRRQGFILVGSKAADEEADTVMAGA